MSWKDKYDRLMARGKALKEKAEVSTEIAIGAAESVATGFALGMVKAKRKSEGKENEIAGVPIPLAVGGVGIVSSFFMKKRSRDALNIGNAGVTCWGYDKGEDYEQKKIAEKAKKSGSGGADTGALPPHVRAAQERARQSARAA